LQLFSVNKTFLNWFCKLLQMLRSWPLYKTILSWAAKDALFSFFYLANLSKQRLNVTSGKKFRIHLDGENVISAEFPWVETPNYFCSSEMLNLADLLIFQNKNCSLKFMKMYCVFPFVLNVREIKRWEWEKTRQRGTAHIRLSIKQN